MASALDPWSDEGPVYDPVPYFWSDQFGHKLQYLGAHNDKDRHYVRHTAMGELHSVIWVDKDGRVTAILLVDSPRDLVQGRKLVETRARPELDRLADPTVALAEPS